jgi:hypothetical protein
VWTFISGTSRFAVDFRIHGEGELDLQGEFADFGVEPTAAFVRVLAGDVVLYEKQGAYPAPATFDFAGSLSPGLYTLEAQVGPGGGVDVILFFGLALHVTDSVAPDVDVAPVALDFGDVELGRSLDLIATVTNLGDAALALTDVSLAPGSDPAFAIDPTPPLRLPGVLEPGGTLDVAVRFTPASAPAVAGWLEIASDDPDEPRVRVALVGSGVPSDDPVMDLLATVFDPAVAAGTLVGSGPGASGPGRLGALRNLLEAASDLVGMGQRGPACSQLAGALARVDGVFPPPDFAEGPDAATLAAAIEALRADLGCDPAGEATRSAAPPPRRGCGIGFELAPLLALLRRARGRPRSSLRRGAR